jgi:STE24 endopeptidase
MAEALGPARTGSRHPSLWGRTHYKVEDWFDERALKESRQYARPLNRLRMIRSAIGIAVTLTFIASDAGPRVIDAVGVDGWALQLIVVLAAFEAVDLLYAPWFSAYVQLIYDKRHGLSTQTGANFLLDVVKDLILSIVLFSALFIPVYAIIRSVDSWWIFGWLVFLGFTGLLTFLYPVVIMPRFNKFTRVEPGELRSRIEAVAARAGEQIEGIYTMDASKRSTRDNAFVAGFGATKRVVIFDTMLEHPIEVIEQVVAHEIGHYRLKHIQKSLAFQAVVTFAVFAFLGWWSSWDRGLEWAGVDSIEDPGSLPYLLLGFGIAFKALSYLSAWYSRAKERQADLEALELLAQPESFIDVWRRMAPKNKAELEPSWLKRLEASHPEIAERMAFGRAWELANH